jgi:hypothetical protein
MPGLESGLVCEARGALASDGYDCWLSLADSADRVEPFTSLPDILRRDSSRELGRVKVRTAMVRRRIS